MIATTRVRPSRWIPIALLVAMTAACAAGSPPAAAPPPPGPSAAAAPTADPAAICGAAVDVSKVVTDGPDLGDEQPTPEQVTAAFAEYKSRLEPPLSAIEQNPPDGLKEDIGTLARQARYAIQNNDAAAISTDEFQAAAKRLQLYAIRECGYTAIRVAATEYSYQGIPPTVPAGTTAFTLVDQGVEPHELNIFKIDDDAQQPVQEIVKLPDVQRAELIDEAGSVAAGPGSADTVFVTLTRGRYGAACYELKGSTADKEGTGPPHATLGEAVEFTVP
jgi:hypothetical protein